MRDLLSFYSQVLQVDHFSDLVVERGDAVVDEGEGLELVQLG